MISSPSGPASNALTTSRRDADHIPGPELLNLLIEQDPPGACDDHVRLLLLPVAVTHPGPQIRCVAKEAYAEVAAVEVLSAKATLEPLHPAADRVLDLEQVDLCKAGHGISSTRSGWLTATKA